MKHNRGRIRPLFLLPLLLSFLAGCQEPPVGALQTAKLALDTAQRAGGIIYAEPAYRAAETLQRAGMLEVARQKGRLAPFRDYTLGTTLLGLAVDQANRAGQHARDRTHSLERLASGDIGALESQLSAYRQSLDSSLTLFHVERYYSDATMALQTARRLFTKGEFAAARRETARGRGFLRRMARALAESDTAEAPFLAMWRRWIDETVSGSRASGGHAVIVDKGRHRAYLLRSGRIVETYRCDLGYNSARQKMYAGDGATPEGKYHVSNVITRSRYFKALRIDYPNADDLRRHADARRRKQVRGSVGGLIEIHGEGGRNEDWTMGCVALSNHDMEDLMRKVGVGTPVTIVRRAGSWP
ncbi:MAG: L,D-transpeptidase family protein [Candidatus Krumholzibacteriia bacterium]